MINADNPCYTIDTQDAHNQVPAPHPTTCLYRLVKSHGYSRTTETPEDTNGRSTEPETVGYLRHLTGNIPAHNFIIFLVSGHVITHGACVCLIN